MTCSLTHSSADDFPSVRSNAELTAAGRRLFVRRPSFFSLHLPAPKDTFLRAISALSLHTPVNRVPSAGVGPSGVSSSGNAAEVDVTTSVAAAATHSAEAAPAPAASAEAAFVPPTLTVSIAAADSATSSAPASAEIETPPHHHTAVLSEPSQPPSPLPHAPLPAATSVETTTHALPRSAATAVPAASTSKHKSAAAGSSAPLPSFVQRLMQRCFAPPTASDSSSLSFEAVQYLRFLQVCSLLILLIFVHHCVG